MSSAPIPRRPPGSQDVQKLAVLTLITSLGYYAVQEVLVRVVEPFDSSHLLASTAPGLRWDALHFLGIATRGYTYEQQLAFQPGWQGLLHILGTDAGAILRRAAIVNTIARVGAVVFLYKLTRALFDRRTALIAGVLYAFPPAPAVLAAPYTETTFALATFVGFYAMTTSKWWASALAFAVAASLRATGVFTTIPLAYAILAPLLKQYGLDIPRLAPRVIFTGILCVIVILPFVTFQAWTWAQFCLPEPTRPWCTKLLPSSYSFVQGEYWNIGLFKYWRPEQVPNIALAVPVLAVSLIGVYRHFTNNTTTCTQAGPSSTNEVVTTAIVVYVALMDALLIFASHTQIALRLAPTDPVVWWTLACNFVSTGGKGRKLNRLEKAWGLWVWVWGAVSLVLWSGHYPPA